MLLGMAPLSEGSDESFLTVNSVVSGISFTLMTIGFPCVTDALPVPDDVVTVAFPSLPITIKL